MDVSYNISEDDYVKAAILFGRPEPKALMVITAIVVIAVGVAYLFGSHVGNSAVAGCLGGLTVFAFIRIVLTPYMLKNHYRNYKAIHEPIRVALTETGIVQVSTTGTSNLSWDKIFKWRHNDEYVLIYMAPRMYFFIPKRIASQGFEMDDLLERLETRVGEAK